MEHVDLYAIDWHSLKRRFIRTLAPDDPLLIRADGKPTQLAEGRATYAQVSDPHNDGDCEWT